MYLSYFDESGDDGFPSYSSSLFILSGIYMHHLSWKENLKKIHEFRRILKKDFDFPVKTEFHTKQFIQDKNPYHGKYSHEERREILFLLYDLIAILDIKIVNVVIDKNNITSNHYDVLENALNYSIQRIENDLKQINPQSRFMVISDEGRVGKMTKTARKIQRINFIPSKYKSGSYRKEIELLIEDPLGKSSKESYFIQLCDAITYVVHLYAYNNLMKTRLTWPKRVRNVLKEGDEELLLRKLINVLNTKASKNNEFGIVYYPK